MLRKETIRVSLMLAAAALLSAFIVFAAPIPADVLVLALNGVFAALYLLSALATYSVLKLPSKSV